MARSGRPGPVDLSLPSDLLDEEVGGDSVAGPAGRKGRPGSPRMRVSPIPRSAALQAATRPVILAGPHLSSREGRTPLAELEQATGVPAVVIESPRGAADATIGAFAGIMRGRPRRAPGKGARLHGALAGAAGGRQGRHS